MGAFEYFSPTLVLACALCFLADHGVNSCCMLRLLTDSDPGGNRRHCCRSICRKREGMKWMGAEWTTHGHPEGAGPTWIGR